MSACCQAADGQSSPGWSRKVRDLLAWLLPGAIFILVPKCPACLAADVMLWTGIGLSFSAAAYLRWGMLLTGSALLLLAIVQRRHRIRTFFRYFKQEKMSCRIKS